MPLPYGKTTATIHFKTSKKKPSYHNEVNPSQISFPFKDTEFCPLNLMFMDSFADGISYH